MGIVQRALVGIGAFALLSACATSTGVLPVGPDTFTVREYRSIARGGFPASERTAFTEADQYCRGQGKVFMTTSTTADVVMDAGGQRAFSLMFECLPPGDPGLHRPSFEQAPNVVIEQRTQ